MSDDAEIREWLATDEGDHWMDCVVGCTGSHTPAGLYTIKDDPQDWWDAGATWACEFGPEWAGHWRRSGFDIDESIASLPSPA